MIGVNKVILIGNLGKNPDVVAFPQDRNDEASNLVKKASFPLATTEYRRNRDGERIEQTESARGRTKTATNVISPKWSPTISLS